MHEISTYSEHTPIAADEIDIDCTEGIVLCVDAVRVLLSGTQKSLDRIRGIAFLVQGRREGIHVRPSRTLPQAGNHARPNKGMFEHKLLLFLTGCLAKKKHRRSGSCRGRGKATRRQHCSAQGWKGITRHDLGLGMPPLMRRTA